MDTKTLAAILLMGHVIAVSVILLVLSMQIKILNGRPDRELHSGRMALLALALSMLFGNFIPIVVDILVLAGSVERNHPSPVGVMYALSNVITLILSATSVLALYIIARKLIKKT